MVDFLYLFAGLVILVKSAGYLVSGAVSLSSKLGISSLVIGLTVVSFGTSMPEFLVTATAALQDNADLAIANVIGSNIANVLLVLGLSAMVRPLPIQDSTVVSEIPFSLTAALLLGFLANAALFSSTPELSISRLDGIIMLFFFVLFLIYVYKVAGEVSYREEGIVELSRLRELAYILLGVVGLYIGGQLVISGAVNVAQLLGVDDVVIGLTIIAVGTSAPELVASIVAAKKGYTDVAVGNVVGSNIFNILWVIGATATIKELPFEIVSNTDLTLVVGSSALILVALVADRSYSINRWHGALFVLLYLAYLVFVINRGMCAEC